MLEMSDTSTLCKFDEGYHHLYLKEELILKLYIKL